MGIWKGEGGNPIINTQIVEDIGGGEGREEGKVVTVIPVCDGMSLSGSIHVSVAVCEL